jgi:hypothetical protein
MRLPALVSILAILTTTPSSSLPTRQSVMSSLPHTFVWAWERPEDLRELSPGIGVAFLAQTISITRNRAHVSPRRQPLRVARGTALLAVSRIEIGASTTRAPIDEIVSSIAATASLPRVAGIQVDFDATASERPLYRDLLRHLRARLPPALPISITALASWCTGDDWLGGLPIDQAVPMLFRMGPSNEPFRRLASASASAAPACRGALGASLDEPIDTRINGRRLYLFNPRPWTETTLFQARRWATR